MNDNQLKKILSHQMYKGKEVSKAGSTFTGYAAKVYTVQEVVECYQQLRYSFMDATHVMCVYRIMDPDVIHMQDCMDNGELGAGRCLLLNLIEDAAENVAVFVIRYQYGGNIGPIRFEMIIDAAKTAIQALPSPLSAVVTSRGQGFSLYNNPPPIRGRGQTSRTQVRIQGGGPGARAPPLTLGFEAPKLSIFGPYLIFP